MKATPIPIVVWAALTAAAVAGEGPARPKFPPHAIPNSELRVLPRNAAGRHYQLHIGLPGSYAKDTSRHYPVVIVTDAYWNFQIVEAIRGSVAYDKLVPEFIIVGLGYSGENLDYGELRQWELSPVPLRGWGTPDSGRAADF